MNPTNRSIRLLKYQSSKLIPLGAIIILNRTFLTGNQGLHKVYYGSLALLEKESHDAWI